ncbi:hypothetical protein DM01DRAFT_1387343 [Hesseltinella vesiculosa]|uniref:CCHC-type domain-containing protein n=1 Tax=Hesseltinella vesiculosa TaxID=101127 RepID=A0A1X2G298_9FUNG|nr:hypothetical protein DM01DRAFT_1387343 [Hesseltinella vesiculosa]
MPTSVTTRHRKQRDILTHPAIMADPSNPWLICGDLNVHLYDASLPGTDRDFAADLWKQHHDLVHLTTERTSDHYSYTPSPTFKSTQCHRTTIDYVLGNDAGAELAQASGQFFLPRLWTDHHLVYVDLTLQRPTMGPGTWCFNNQLLGSELFMAQLEQLLAAFHSRRKRPDLSPQEQWEDMKTSVQILATNGGTTLISYAEIAKRTCNVTIPRGVDMAPGKDTFFGATKPTFETLFEEPDLMARKTISDAERILEAALDPSNVLLTVPTKFFENIVEAYKVVQNNLGPVIGISPVQGDFQKKEMLMLDIKFKNEADSRTAIDTGVVIEGMTFKATPANAGGMAPTELVRLHISRVPKVDDKELITGLKESCSNYGEVMQISKYTRGGFFEGEVSVLLDRSSAAKPSTGDEVSIEEESRFLPLSRMMYLTQWDVTAPVRYRGAPKLCFHCRRTDHQIKDCPKWAEVICYRCKGHGHIKRFCRAKLLNKNEHKHEATTLATDTSDATADPSQLPKNPTLEMDNITGTTEPLEESPDNTQTDSDVDMDPEHADSMTTITTEDEPMLDSVTGTPDEDEDTIVTVRLKDRTSTGNGNAGTAASKHATYAIGTSMKTDTMEEMTEHREETIASPSGI